MIEALAQCWGRGIGGYGMARVNAATLECVMDTPVPAEPCIWLGWHEANLITVAVHRHAIRRPVVALIPAGLTGVTMRAWLERLGVGTIVLPGADRAGGALKAMRAALKGGHDVLLAADGPNGPRREVKAGALWLSKATGAKVCPVGCAAAPSVRLPRWDRHLVPLPGARICAVFGADLPLSRDPRCDGAKAHARETLNRLTERAAARLRPAPPAAEPEAEIESQTTHMGKAR